MEEDKQRELHDGIMKLTSQYYEIAHKKKEFVPGISKVAYSGRVFDDEELRYGVDSVLQYWLTAGPYAAEFEMTMKKYFDSRDCFLVNSGSSANLLMISTLCSPN